MVVKAVPVGFAQSDLDNIGGIYRLLEAVFRRAALDARRGCPEAQAWLRAVAPEDYVRLVEGEMQNRRYFVTTGLAPHRRRWRRKPSPE